MHSGTSNPRETERMPAGYSLWYQTEQIQSDEHAAGSVRRKPQEQHYKVKDVQKEDFLNLLY